MTVSIVLFVSIVCYHQVLSIGPSFNAVATLRRLEERLSDRQYTLSVFRDKLRALHFRRESLRKTINGMNDDTRITCFELNYVPKFCTDDADRYIVLQQFASAIGFTYKDSDIVEIKYFLKKTGGDFMSKTDYLNYIVRVKTLAIKEAWLNQFNAHVKNCGYKWVYSFPGVCKDYNNNNNNLDGDKKSDYLGKRYSLVNVTMRDHISPFKVSLMAVVRGKIKPKRHYYRVKVNRSDIIVERLLPMRRTITYVINDFSDIAELDSLL